MNASRDTICSRCGLDVDRPQLFRGVFGALQWCPPVVFRGGEQITRAFLGQEVLQCGRNIKTKVRVIVSFKHTKCGIDVV